MFWLYLDTLCVPCRLLPYLKSCTCVCLYFDMLCVPFWVISGRTCCCLAIFCFFLLLVNLDHEGVVISVDGRVLECQNGRACGSRVSFNNLISANTTDAPGSRHAISHPSNVSQLEDLAKYAVDQFNSKEVGIMSHVFILHCVNRITC